MKDKIIIYTDAGSRGNPGIAGAGVVIQDGAGQIVKKIAKPLGVMTNNEAEYRAVIEGLQAAKRIFGKGKMKNAIIEVRADSELVVSQLKGEYQIKEEKLFPLFIKIWNLQVKDLPKVVFTYIPREQNRLADQLANQAMDEAGSTNVTLFA